MKTTIVLKRQRCLDRLEDAVADKKKEIVVYLDQEDKVVPKEEAIQMRIITYDDQGNRREVYGFVVPDPLKPREDKP